jgi:SAM-dependent MidA family methyltransferase
MNLMPPLTPDAQKHSQQLIEFIQQNIQQAGGWISFAEFMQMALYTPGLGYYAAGSPKFGMGGDFVTAPEMSPLFARVLSNQIAEVLTVTQGNILELGAGTGKLAADILLALVENSILPKQYFILEVSDHLRQVQRETLASKLPKAIFECVEWLTVLPEHFVGIILGNEVLDAIPVHLIHMTLQGICERGVAYGGSGFEWQDQPLTEKNLLNTVTQLNLPTDYLTEFCPAAQGLMTSLADCLAQGAVIMIDYGFAAHEYYHPQRNLGTLMCHYQQLAHPDPLLNIGLQDITAHVDFTGIAQAGVNQDLQLAGFCSQAQFLMNCGILDVMSQVSPHDMAQYAPIAAAAQKLLSPAEMGDLFKVIGFTKNMDMFLMGFSTGDKSHTL